MNIKEELKKNWFAVLAVVMLVFLSATLISIYRGLDSRHTRRMDGYPATHQEKEKELPGTLAATEANILFLNAKKTGNCITIEQKNKMLDVYQKVTAFLRTLPADKETANARIGEISKMEVGTVGCVPDIHLGDMSSYEMQNYLANTQEKPVGKKK